MEDMKVRKSLDRHMSTDKKYSCSQRCHCPQRKEPSLWFRRRPDQKALTSRQVWRVRQRLTTRQQWQVRRMLWTPSRWRAGKWRVSRWRVSRWRVSKGASHSNRWRASDHGRPSWSCRPSTPSGAGRGGQAHDDDDPAGVAGPAHSHDQAVNDPAWMDEPVAHGTPAGNTPAAAHDSSLSSDFSAIFPSLPKAINQNQLVDFMAMWTLMQHRMDPGMTAPDTQARPVAQTPTPTPRDDDTSARKSKTPLRTPDRQPRTPVRRPRTPVRRARVTDDSRDSTHSRSPIGISQGCFSS